VMIATEMPAAIRPYSIAVAPDSSRSQRGTEPRATSCRNTGRHHLAMPGRLRRNPQSLDTPSRKFRILKSRSVETGHGISGSRRKTTKIPRQRPGFWPRTSRNVGSLQSSGSHPQETAVAGWVYKIRTAIAGRNKILRSLGDNLRSDGRNCAAEIICARAALPRICSLGKDFQYLSAAAWRPICLGHRIQTENARRK
jgi:hypothetical protein